MSQRRSRQHDARQDRGADTAGERCGRHRTGEVARVAPAQVADRDHGDGDRHRREQPGDRPRRPCAARDREGGADLQDGERSPRGQDDRRGAVRAAEQTKAGAQQEAEADGVNGGEREARAAPGQRAACRHRLMGACHRVGRARGGERAASATDHCADVDDRRRGRGLQRCERRSGSVVVGAREHPARAPGPQRQLVEAALQREVHLGLEPARLLRRGVRGRDPARGCELPRGRDEPDERELDARSEEDREHQVRDAGAERPREIVIEQSGARGSDHARRECHERGRWAQDDDGRRRERGEHQ